MAGKVIATAAEKHLGDVTNVIYHNGFVYTAGSDGKLMIFDENLKQMKEAQIHEAHIYALALDRNSGKLYSSSCDSTIKVMEKPLESDQIACILNSDNEIESLFVDEKGNFYAGDDHGGVTMFENGKLKCKMNMVEAVHGLIVEENDIYTIRNLDLSVHNFNKETGKCFMRGQVAGKNPICLLGQKIEGRKEFVVVPTRDGKGLQINKNVPGFPTVHSKDNLHEMIINAVHGTENYLFSACYQGVIKRLNPDLTEAGEVKVGICANTLAVEDDNTIYVGFTDGSIQKISF